jgi:hypothetical protein
MPTRTPAVGSGVSVVRVMLMIGLNRCLKEGDGYG